MIEYIFPIFVGIIAGTLYGCSFLLQQRSILYSHHPFGRLRTTGFFIMRIAILAITAFYLLRLSLVQSILGLGAFFILFWLVVITLKARLHGKTGPQ